MAELDYKLMVRQFLRAVRGRRSQVAFSRRLGFGSNVAAQWESGRRVPAAHTALRACEGVGIDVHRALTSFRPATTSAPATLHRHPLALWLDAQRGKETVSSVARRAGMSRPRVSRFLSGQCAPRLHEFFQLVAVTTNRLSDLIALLVDIAHVPALAPYHAQVVASRRVAFDEPWSSAVLATLECVGDLRINASAQLIAGALELAPEAVEQCLGRLEQAGVIQRSGARYRLSTPLVVETGAVPDGARRLRQHWAYAAAKRAEQPRGHDVFSYNVFSVSREDLIVIGRLQREHFQRIRTIVAHSKPETVALLNLQLVEWDPTPTTG